MRGAAESMQQDQRVPRLAPGWEAKAADLSPEEGFVLSRVDGVTPWGVLRSIAGLPPDQVDACLERWLRDGLLELARARRAGPKPGAARGVDSSQVDPSLELPVEFQEEILAFEARLERPYHELLGVAVDADERTIKRAYFKLSRLYHPDRYFRRKIGGFEARLDRVFKKVALAYELLRDPATREELQRSLAAVPEPEPEPTPGKPPPRNFTKREWLARMRKRFRIPDEVLAARKHRAKELAEAARVAQHQGSWNEAASAIRLAIAFDPWTDAFKDLFAEIHVQVNRVRAERLLEEASGAFDSRSRKEALALYEEVIAYRPTDAAAHDRAAQLALEDDDLERAREYAEQACELSPKTADYHLTLGRVLRREGLRDRAKAALEEARSLDPSNPKIMEELTRLRPRSGRSSGGKR